MCLEYGHQLSLLLELLMSYTQISKTSNDCYVLVVDESSLSPGGFQIRNCLKFFCWEFSENPFWQS
jgi:hypothetical protein